MVKLNEEQIRAEFEDIIRNKMTSEEFWAWVKSWMETGIPIENALLWHPKYMLQTIEDFKQGKFKPKPISVCLGDCKFLEGVGTKGGGLSYYYHPESHSIIEFGVDDTLNIVFLITPVEKYLREEVADEEDFIYQKLLEISAVNREICSECGESVAMGSGKFVNRIPVLDDDQIRIESSRPYWWGDFICEECDNKNRQEGE